eukprot:s2199_g3.t4
MAESSKGRYKLELGEEVQVRLRDLLLRCPCAALDGIRWSVVCKVYADRYQGGPLIGASALDAAKTCLADLATFDEAAPGNARLRLREEAALSAGKDGQLGCWPLLLQRLGEIVRNHGSAQPLQGTEAEHIGTGTGEGKPTDLNLGHGRVQHEGEEVLGVLLGQLKHLLSRYWDPAFEERGLSFFNEVGQFVHLRKMKHFLAELLKWRARRRELVLNKALPPSAIDEALGDQLMLVASQRHNDMVLCCPACPAVMPAAAPAAARPASLATPPKAQRGREGGSPKSGIGISEESPGSDEVPDPKRQELLEKESRRLRIENAELKKRLQFGSEFLKQDRTILKSSWAHAVRLKPGDWLISINGDAITKMREHDCFELLQRHRPLRLLFARRCSKSATPKLKRPNKIAVKLDEAILFSQQNSVSEPSVEVKQALQNVEEEDVEEEEQVPEQPASAPAGADTKVDHPAADHPAADHPAPSGEAIADEPMQQTLGPEELAHEAADVQTSPAAFSAQDAQGSTIFSEQYDVDDFDDFEPEDSMEKVEIQQELEAHVTSGGTEDVNEDTPPGDTEAKVEQTETSATTNAAELAEEPSHMSSTVLSDQYEGDWDEDFEEDDPDAEGEDPEVTQRNVTFAPEADALADARDDGSAVAPRQGTGFVRMSDLPDDDEDDESEVAGKNVTFSPEVEESRGDQSSNWRQGTGFVRVSELPEDSPEADERIVSFSPAGCSQDDQMDGDESQVCRKGTGFVRVADLPDDDESEEERAVHFSPEVDELGENPSPSAPRKGTGYVRTTDLPDDCDEDDEPEAQRNVTFAVANDETPSPSAPRKGTGYVRTVDLPDDDDDDSEAQRTVSFAPGSKVPAQASSPSAPRKGTGYVNAADLPEDDDDEDCEAPRNVSFSPEVDALEEDRSTAAPRKGTGFVQTSDLPSDEDEDEQEDRAVHFSPEVEDTGKTSSPSAPRKGTGYVRVAALPDDDDDDSEAERKVTFVPGSNGNAKGHAASPSAPRKGTGYVRTTDIPDDDSEGQRNVSFSPEVDALGEERSASAPRKGTGFVNASDLPSDDEDEEERLVHFSPEVDALEEIQNASPSAPRKGTGYVRTDDLPSDGDEDDVSEATRNVTFAPGVQGSSETPSPTAPRKGTGYVRTAELPDDDDDSEVQRVVSFAPDSNMPAETASPSAPRKGTGYVNTADLPEDDDDDEDEAQRNVSFAPDVAAREANQASARKGTGFVKTSDIPSDDDEDEEEESAQRRVSFEQEELEVQASPSAPRKGPESAQRRVSFEQEELEVQASLSAPRKGTGFVSAADIPDDEDEDEEEGAANAYEDDYSAPSSRGSGVDSPRAATESIGDDEPQDLPEPAQTSARSASGDESPTAQSAQATVTSDHYDEDFDEDFEDDVEAEEQAQEEDGPQEQQARF